VGHFKSKSATEWKRGDRGGGKKTVRGSFGQKRKKKNKVRKSIAGQMEKDTHQMGK